ncbi:MAG: caspase family protein [Hyphomicrobium sp.]
MKSRLLLLAFLMFGALGAAPDCARAADATQLRDPVTGVELQVPTELLGKSTQATHGMNWRSGDGRLNVDTLRFPPERSLDSIRDKLRSIPGRQITREQFTPNLLALEGTDGGKAHFIIRVEAQGDGTKKGVSVVYPTSGSATIGTAARSIVNSMKFAGGPATASRVAQRFDNPRPCHLTPDRAEAMAAGIKVEASISGDRKVAAGDPVELSWSLATPLQATCNTPLFLVLSVPPDVRFAGDGFLALMPGAAAPFGIAHDIDQVRVFVPLHDSLSERRGKLILKPYVEGPWKIRAALIEVPTWSSESRSVADLAGNKAVIATIENSELSFAVRPSRPQIVVQDQFTLETPSRTIQSVNGRYTLQEFSNYYRALDRQSGELIVQRVGTDPEFSPTDRFVAALLEDKHSIEIVDLVSQTTFGGFRSEEIGSYIGRGVLPIAWGLGDSLVLTGPIKGDGQVYNSLVDRKPTAVALLGSKHSTIKTAAIRADLESMGVAFREHYIDDQAEAKWASLVNPSATSPRFASPMHAPLTTGEGYSWQLGGDIKFTNVPDAPTDLSERLREEEQIAFTTEEAKADSIRQVREQHARDLRDYEYVDAHRVRHARPDESRPVATVVAAARLSQVRAAVHNANPVSNDVFGQFAERLSRLSGLSLKKPLPRSHVRGPLFKEQYVVPLDGDTSPDAELADALTEHVRSRAYQQALAKMFVEIGETNPGKRSNLSDVPADFACQYYTPEGSFGTFVSPRRIMGRTGWPNGPDRYWLIQQDCWGGSGWRSVQLGFLTKRAGSTPKFVSLTGDRQDHVEQYGLNSAKLARGWITDDEVLIVAMPNRTTIMHDIKSGKRLAMLRDVEGTEFAADIRLTSDRSRLVMMTEGGRIGIFNVKSGTRVLGGYFIDDELILHNDDGYYLSTPEGAHFVHVRFPGSRGYSTVNQFARTLDRPEAIRDILRGKPSPPRPDLTPPPRLEMTASPSQSDAARSAKIKFKASSEVGLSRLKVFVDGRMVRELEATGPSVDTNLDVSLPLEARWISAVAIDAKGYESMPNGEPLGGAGKPVGRLHLISVGTDRYDHMDAKFQLSGAVRDARTIKAAAMELGGKIYKEVIPQVLVDDVDLRSNLPARIREAVQAAAPEDTIMIFAAGHGSQGKDGRFYLMTRNATPGDIEITGLAWDEIGRALDGTKARVVVFLDACRSGSAGGASTNDDVVSSLIGRKTPITVIASAKGRQDSEEGAGGEGGRFTNAILRAITSGRAATDTNGNGAIELAELYGAVKREVLQATGGRQTPWIARNQRVGEVPLF